jgi:hypothetical protein
LKPESGKGNLLCRPVDVVTHDFSGAQP